MQQAHSSSGNSGAITYCRLNCVLDGRHMRIDESAAPALRNMMLLTRDYLRKERCAYVCQSMKSSCHLSSLDMCPTLFQNNLTCLIYNRAVEVAALVQKLAEVHPENQISGSSAERRLTAISGSSNSLVVGRSDSSSSSGSGFSVGWPWFSSPSSRTVGDGEWAVAAYGEEQTALSEGGNGLAQQVTHSLYAWRASRPFRAWRKSVARATGVSGFFSGKAR